MRQGLSAAEAQRAVLDLAPRLGAETVPTREALGRMLAEPVVSERRIPPADNSAMDGYALRAEDAGGPATALPVVFEIAAGGVADRFLEPGHAARILTGAPIPAGADSVVRQEDTRRQGDTVRILIDPKPGDHIRPAGDDVEIGDRVLDPGTRIGAAHLGMLAALGRSVVSVTQRPRVAILSGGDELVEPDGDVAGGRIVSSNSYSLSAQCREVGADPFYLGIARDDPADIEERLRAGLRADVLVSSAGVSVGDRDHVRNVLEALGCRLHFWGVNVKPGYPLVFGRFENPPGPLVFGLPGNPVSAMVTFEQFVRPALLAMSGATRLFRPRVRARLTATLTKDAGRMHFVRVRLARDGDEVLATATANQSSGVLRSMIEAHGLLIFPAADTELRSGEEAWVQVLDPDALAVPESGL